MHVVVIDPDVAVAKAVTSLALDVLPAHTETVIVKVPTEEGARRLIESLSSEHARLIVVCASDFADGGKGLSVLRYVRARRPDARVVLLTGGEREELARGLLSGADGVLAKPLALSALRSVLSYLGGTSSTTVDVRPQERDPRVELRQAIAALENAIVAVEQANDRVCSAQPAAMDLARRSLQEAEVLAAQAHRRALEAEQRLGQTDPQRSNSQT